MAAAWVRHTDRQTHTHTKERTLYLILYPIYPIYPIFTPFTMHCHIQNNNRHKLFSFTSIYTGPHTNFIFYKFAGMFRVHYIGFKYKYEYKYFTDEYEYEYNTHK